MAIRASKMRPRESHMIDKRGDHMANCRVESIGDNVFGLERFVALGAPPLREAASVHLEQVSARYGVTSPLPVIVAAPEVSRPDFDARLGRELLSELGRVSGVALDFNQSSIVFGGRGGGVDAFRRGLDVLRRRAADAVLVGGVDSYFHPDVLEALDADYRLHGLKTENGFIPGEGAAFVLLQNRSHSGGFYHYAHIHDADMQMEPRPYSSEEPCHALAMSLALQNVARQVGPTARRVPWVLTDVQNERHRVNEWQLAMGRQFEIFTPEVKHDQPLLETGDIGAASAAMLVAIACMRWQLRCAVGELAIVATHSDGQERGALLLGAEAA